jgi:Cft2 family RNA processing exonuclease
MTVDIEVIPISSDTDLFQCSVLRVGDYRILLDCGWAENFDVTLLEDLIDDEDLLGRIDAVLISHYDLAHCGALPYLVSRKKLRGQIFATECVKRMGELTLASLHEDIDKSKDMVVSDDSYTMTIEDIVTSFASVEPLQFNEIVRLGGSGISITAQPAGRLIGGAYWIITVGSQRIVYTVDYSLVTDTHVSGLSVLPAKKANVLITDTTKSISGGNNSVGVVAAKKHQVSNMMENMMEMIKSTLRSDGSVLIPVDPNGRVLELLLALEAAFTSEAGLLIYPVVFLSPLGDVVLDQVKTRMEWMNKSILTEFENSVNFTAHPFIFKHVEVMASLNDLNESYSYRKPKVVLATCASLDYGDSRELFCRMSNDANNLVLLTHVTGLVPSSLAARLIKDIGSDQQQQSSSGEPLTYRETQFMKSNLPDEQLRDLYREALQKEAQDDEIKRRRAREKFLAATTQQGGGSAASNLTSAAPSSASAVPVDLIRITNEETLEIDGSAYFRPQLFVAQTVATNAVISTKPQMSDYGDQLNTIEVDTWRAHAETSDMGAAKEASAEAAAAGHSGTRVKGERGVKSSVAKEEQMKGDLYADEEMGGRIKGELGLMPSSSVGGQESFDWRKDMYIRFGEQKRVEVRERVIKVVCKVRVMGLDGHAQSNHRREFLSSVKPKNLILLPTRNLPEIQLISLLLPSTSKLWVCQENTVPNLDEGQQVSLVSALTIPVELEIPHEKKWINVDPSVYTNVEFVAMKGTDIRVAKLASRFSQVVGPLYPGGAVSDLLQVPSGEYIEYAVCANEKSGKRTRQQLNEEDDGGGLLLSNTPWKLNRFAQEVRSMSDSVKFVSTGHSKRALLIDEKAIVSTGISNNDSGEFPVVEIASVPSDSFYKLREMIYRNAACI